MSQKIDTQGLSCPQPMLMVKKAMEEQKSGYITVTADAEASRENISRIAKHLGWTKTVETVDNKTYFMEFSK